jgi:nitrogen fixation NifU-like protein
MMTEFLKGKTEAEALDLFERMHELLTGEEADLGELASLGKLAALSGVRQYPTRVKCASLCWHTMKSALAGGDAVSTE